MSEVLILRFCLILILVIFVFNVLDNNSGHHRDSVSLEAAPPPIRRGVFGTHTIRASDGRFVRPFWALNQPLYHFSNTKFIRSEIAVQYRMDSEKTGIRGLVVKSEINAGEILIVEYPLLRLETDTSSKTTTQHQIEQKVASIMEMDPYFRRIWHSIPQKVAVDQRLVLPITKRKWLQSFGIYALLSRITTVNPETSHLSKHRENVAVIFGGTEDEYVCIVMAIRDIPQGTELLRGSHPRSVVESQSLGVVPHSKSEKFVDFVNSGQIFQVIRGVNMEDPPDWTGQPFVRQAACEFHRKTAENPARWTRLCNDYTRKRVMTTLSEYV